MQKTPGLRPGVFYAVRAFRAWTGGASRNRCPRILVLSQSPRESAARFSRENRLTLFLELLRISAPHRRRHPVRPACGSAW
ncbi:hypothetical protein EN974_30360 [Mesorhizobium sp. M7A.F.Ca.CA.001.12.2.1]|nr:hypothetical protein EN974_30360 [Mesorhizobium sp. M7A.F.Ca.CA.001.12.2.1]RUZ27787.1 hypothetical protein EN949_08685 [Mesorhizobium sp. M7A.F.Ca.US.007.01.2.1]RUZ49053.1 hypothetical protein EN948_06150 [Mesorhizobium sp. M7A.F.Ca.US.003.02.1.1]RUZ70131.1 hypothetical protein EN950_01725 [Mesorhizobium sp. M7A.F.Ca.US.007.01.1.1]RUZ92658.1 hypothetical protein EN947_00630 [Mesorhizobium sp. M7A.F.Ca.US.003.02.2.1]